MSFLNAFGNMKGFDAVLEFINFEILDPKVQPMNNVARTIKGCPF